MIECDQINIMIWNAISTFELMIDFYCVCVCKYYIPCVYFNKKQESYGSAANDQ